MGNTAKAEFIRWIKKESAETAVRDGLSAVYPRLWRFCLVLCNNRERADDLAQQTCARALSSASKFKPGTHLDRWLFTIARRLWLNEIRAAKVRQGAGVVSVDDVDLSDKKPAVETNILAREVFHLIERLPDAQRLTVLLVYVEGYTYREAAEELECPIGTVMSRLAAARKALAGQMG